jgi:hypothetical protein
MLMMAVLRRCWPLCDVVEDSCWQWHNQVDVCHGIADNHASDGVVEAMLTVALPTTMLT